MITTSLFFKLNNCLPFFWLVTRVSVLLINPLPFLDTIKSSSSIDEEFLIVSKNGKGFISNTETLVTNQKKGKQLFNLKNNDVVIKVLNLSKKHIACVTKLQKMLIFEIDALPKLQKGGGVQLIKIKKDDFLSDVTQLTIEDGLEWSTGSKNRKLEDVEFWMGKRAQAGKKVPKYFNKNLKFD